MQSYDVIVIGGGLLGCFAARALTRYDLRVALLEKRGDLCTGISRANSAIVYSGCDTRPGTLKSSMCVRAAQNFPALCGELGVRYSACGSVMVCFGPRGAAILRKKLEQGAASGVRGMKLLTRGEVLELEPNIAGNVHSGLFVPDTGTVMPWEMCLAAAESAVKNGAEIILHTEVTALAREPGARGGRLGAARGPSGESSEPGRNGGNVAQTTGGYIVRTAGGDFHTRAVVNCAGLFADRVHEMAYEPQVRIVPTAGDYFVLDTKAAGHIRRVIFHEPEEKGKGLTLVPTVDGNILVGATERLFPAHADHQNEAESFATAREGLERLRALVSEVVPTLPMEHVINSFGAVRPNPYLLRRDPGGAWVTDDRSISEFCIIEPGGEPFISFIGVKTPGLTCSCELGEYAAKKIAARLGAARNEQFDPCRTPAPRLCDLPPAERNALIRDNPDYGVVACRCRGTSEGEIIDAIRRFPGAVTLDGVKRRTGADTGRCQGGYCTQRIIEILARELGCGPGDITKDGEGSNVLLRGTK